MGWFDFAAFVLASAAPATTLPPSDPPVLTAAEVAAVMQEGLPHRYDGGISMVAVAAVREVLVVTFDVPAAFTDDLDPEAIAREFAAGFCGIGDANLYFEQGMRVRVDTTVDGGAPVPGLIIDRCPAGTEGGGAESL
ncbi:MAG TPA: hypothetical protein VN231_01245 [Allosphingosinicella sp.]|nr:hypothetical protein [Allosphingosinicella sp.]